jgi:hypothetical protein
MSQVAVPTAARRYRMPTSSRLGPPAVVGAAVAAAVGVAVRIWDQTTRLGDGLHVSSEARAESIASTATAEPLPVPKLAGIDLLVAAFALAALPVTGRMLVGQAAAALRVRMWRRRGGVS